MVALTKGTIEPSKEVADKYKPNAFLLRYKKDGKLVELSGDSAKDLAKKAEEISMKVEEAWTCELFDDGTDTFMGMVHHFVGGKEVDQHHKHWTKLQKNLSGKAKKASESKQEETTKVQTIKSVDTQGKEVKMTKEKKTAKAEPKKAEKPVAKKGKETNAGAKADAVKAKRPAKISGKLEKIEAPADKAVGKKEAEALFTALQVRENTVRWNAARYLADNMGLSVPVDVLINKTYGKDGGTTASIGRVVDGIMANAEKNKVKIIVSSIRRDGKFFYRMEKA